MQQKLPRRGQAQEAVGADKQHNPKLLLQGRHRPADGGVAGIEGAGRFRKMWNITLPSIRPTIVVLLIMNLGNILGGGFDRPFAMSNNLVLRASEVIATYVYKTGIKGLQFSLTTAVGLFQSVVGVFFLLMANWLSRKLGERGIW